MPSPTQLPPLCHGTSASGAQAPKWCWRVMQPSSMLMVIRGSALTLPSPHPLSPNFSSRRLCWYQTLLLPLPPCRHIARTLAVHVPVCLGSPVLPPVLLLLPLSYHSRVLHPVWQLTGLCSWTRGLCRRHHIHLVLGGRRTSMLRQPLSHLGCRPDSVLLVAD